MLGVLGRAAIKCSVVTAALSLSAAAANAALVHPAGIYLNGLTITPGYTDSFFSDVVPNYGDATVLDYINAVFSGGLIQVGSSANSDCGGSNVTCLNGPPKSGTFSGLSANVFAVHYGGNGGN